MFSMRSASFGSYFITEHSVEVLAWMFGFLFGFLTKFLLHFIDIHRYVSPANEIDYLCIRLPIRYIFS